MIFIIDMQEKKIKPFNINSFLFQDCNLLLGKTALFISVFYELTRSNTVKILAEEIKIINENSFEVLLSFYKMIFSYLSHLIASCLIC